MKFNKLLFLFLILTFGAQAQTMNVRKWRQTERDSLDKAVEFFEEKQYLKGRVLGRPEN